jgi:UDP-glucose:(heptosyl)LPS alpha-1,3-glucosyltransferase
MKIALVRKDFTNKKGGAEGYIVTLSNQLARSGQEVHIYAAKIDAPKNEKIFTHLVPLPRIRNFAYHISFAKNCEKMLRAENFDIINGLSRIWYQDIYRSGDPLFIHWLKSHKPNILDKLLSAVNPKEKAMLSLEKKVFTSGMLRRVIAISNLDKMLISRYYGFPDEKVQVIYNGVDFERFNPGVRRFRKDVRSRLGIPEESAAALFVALDFKRKGLNSLIKSLALLGNRGENLICVVVGNGKFPKYEARAKRCGIADRIVFAGTSANVEQFYGAADFFVFPTLYDPFANVHLEALACGLPVITTREAGGAELIREGENGFVISPSDNVNELSEKILALMDGAVREKMSRIAAESVKDFTVERNARSVLKLYEEVLEEKRGQSR